MKIYVASSWRNPYQQNVVMLLRHDGHEVYDFQHPTSGDTGFSWSQIDPDWKQWSTEQYKEALTHPVAGAEVCVLVLPCGRSAHTEAGWMSGAGKKVFVLTEGGEEPELMYKIYDGICPEYTDLQEALTHVKPVSNTDKLSKLEELLQADPNQNSFILTHNSNGGKAHMFIDGTFNDIAAMLLGFSQKFEDVKDLITDTAYELKKQSEPAESVESEDFAG